MIDSGIDWIGKIPDTWKLIPLKYASKEINEKNNPIRMENILSLTNTLGVVPYEEKGNQGNVSKDDLSQYKIAYKNTIIINSMNLKIGSVGLSKYDGCVSPVYYVLSNNDLSDIRFLNYIFQSDFQKYLGRYGKGIMEIREKISMYDVLHSYIPLPDISVQKRISDYLDNKCNKIDNIILDYEKGLKLLEEYKQSIISNVIEKGFGNKTININNKYVRQVPETTKLVTLKQITSLITDGTHQTPNYLPEGIPFLSIKDISNGKVDLDDCKYISPDEHCLLSKHANIEPDDLLFCRIGTLGKPVVVKKETLPFSIFVSLGLIKVKKELISPYYLRYVMLSNYYNSYIDAVKVDGGVSAAKFNLSSVKNSPIILPTLNEQNKIIEYLDNKCIKLDAIIEYRKKIIERLNEYKKSLIYEVVTGKKEV